MPEISRLTGNNDGIELDVVEREETPQELMKLGIHLHAAGLSLSDTIPILDKIGVQHCRSTVHNWVQKASLQPTDGKNPDHVAVDETVIQIDTQRYWLYAAVDPQSKNISTSDWFHREFKLSLRCSSTSFAKNIRLRMRRFSSMERHGSTLRSIATGSDSSMKHIGIGTLLKVSLKN